MIDTWHPIISAPKDGTAVLIHVPYREIDNGITILKYNAITLVGLFDGGVWVAEVYDGFDFDPTHWMQLPQPPTPTPKEHD